VAQAELLDRRHLQCTNRTSKEHPNVWQPSIIELGYLRRYASPLLTDPALRDADPESTRHHPCRQHAGDGIIMFRVCVDRARFTSADAVAMSITCKQHLGRCAGVSYGGNAVSLGEQDVFLKWRYAHYCHYAAVEQYSLQTSCSFARLPFPPGGTCQCLSMLSTAVKGGRATVKWPPNSSTTIGSL
jgi:hypothetical protein